MILLFTFHIPEGGLFPCIVSSYPDSYVDLFGNIPDGGSTMRRGLLSTCPNVSKIPVHRESFPVLVQTAA